MNIPTAFTLTRLGDISAFTSLRSARRFSAENAIGGLVVTTEEDLDAALSTYVIKPADLWNSLDGVKPVAKFTSRNTGISRIWKQLQSLETAPEPAALCKVKAGRSAVTKKVIRSVSKQAALRAQPAAPARPATKQDQAMALIKRAQGATITELMSTFGWQRHTVRGFMVTVVQRKLGLTVESTKPEGGERTYRVTA